MKHLSTILLCLAIGFAATGARAQSSEAILPDGPWADPNSWSNGVPDSSVDAVIGSSNHNNVGITVYAGTDGQSSNLTIAGRGDGHLTVEAGGTLYVGGNLNIGHTSYMNEGWNFEVHQEGGTVEVGAWGGGFYMSGWAGTTTSLYKASGTSLIMAGGMMGYTGYGFWQMGGTFEIAGDVTVDVPNGPAIFASGFAPVAHDPILKFSGTDPKLTVDGDAHFRSSQDGASNAAQIDVSELNLSQVRTWVTIIDVLGTLNNGDQVAFVPGTDPNDWDLQVVGNEVQVKDNYCTNVIDDDELSLILAHWGEPWPPGFPDPDPWPRFIDDDVLSLLLAQWGECADGWVWPGGPLVPHDAVLGFASANPGAGGLPAPEAVPEPMTLGLLAVGGLGVLLRKRR